MPFLDPDLHFQQIQNVLETVEYKTYEKIMVSSGISIEVDRL